MEKNKSKRLEGLSEKERDRVRYHRSRMTDISCNVRRYKEGVLQDISADKDISDRVKEVLIAEAQAEPCVGPRIDISKFVPLQNMSRVLKRTGYKRAASPRINKSK